MYISIRCATSLTYVENNLTTGEYIATKSQDEVLRGEIKLENHHIQNYHSDEVKELPELLSLIGIPTVGHETLRNQLVQYYSSNEDALLKVMVALEFGFLERERRQPFLAGLTSGCLFFLGSLPSVIPFAICKDPFNGVYLAIVCTSITLLVIGVVKSFATRMNWFYSSFENFIIAALGGLLAFYIGLWLQ